MIGNQNVEAAKLTDGGLHECAGRLDRAEVTGNGGAAGCAAFFDKFFRLVFGSLIVEDDTCTCGDEDADGCGTDSTGAAGNECDFTVEGYGYGHGG